MKVRGARLIVKALEDEGVRFTFGIPGTHTMELYDALEESSQIEPVLITNEQAGSFMADGVSRTSGQVGVLTVVPGAGVTHCLSGVAEAFMDNVPLVVIACGIRNDTGNAYQLHDIDQLAVLRPVTKQAFRAEQPDQIYPLVRRAFQIARRGTPGPVAVEIPANFLLLTQDIAEPCFQPDPEITAQPGDLIQQAAQLLGEAENPAIYVGAGAAAASGQLVRFAEQLAAPVTTTFQGKGVFPENHALWLWNGFGPQAPRFVRKIMDRCDCLLAIGCRFGEVATGSYGLVPPGNLIHVDINPDVFNRNFPARLAIEADAGSFLQGVAELIRGARPAARLEREIAAGHAAVNRRWAKHPSPTRVSPFAFFAALKRHCGADTIYTTDSGNGTFLAMEHLRLSQPSCFIGPIDFSCMGYSVPAAIGAALVNPGRDVVALAGDGAMLMTGLEVLTAATYRAAPLICVLRDGSLGQIAQFQQHVLRRATCSRLPDYSVEDLARATGCRYFRFLRDREFASMLPAALELTRAGNPVLAEVAIDYSRKTYFTQGVLRTNFKRLPLSERLRMIKRVAKRVLTD